MQTILREVVRLDMVGNVGEVGMSVAALGLEAFERSGRGSAWERKYTNPLLCEKRPAVRNEPQSVCSLCKNRLRRSDVKQAALEKRETPDRVRGGWVCEKENLTRTDLCVSVKFVGCVRGRFCAVGCGRHCV